MIQLIHNYLLLKREYLLTASLHGIALKIPKNDMSSWKEVGLPKWVKRLLR